MFKIRASQIGTIMSGEIGLTKIQEEKLTTFQLKIDSGKELTKKQKEEQNILLYKKENPELPKGAKTYCEKWLKDKIYNRIKEFTSKYTEKGNVVEDDSLDFIAEQLGYGILIKNEEYFENEYITGTPDVNLPNEIIDAKNSWQYDTFPLLDSKLPNKDYYWQGQGYMVLCKKEYHKVVYVLSDTPDYLIEKEAYMWCRNNGYEELEMSILEKFTEKMTYDDVPNELKIRVFEIDKNQEDINNIYIRVIMCRKYISDLIKIVPKKLGMQTEYYCKEC